MDEKEKQMFVTILSMHGGSVVDVVNGTRAQATAFARGKADKLGAHGVTVRETEIVAVEKVVNLSKKEG